MIKPSTLISDRPVSDAYSHVRDVMTTHGPYILKFAKCANRSAYHQKILLEFGLPVVAMEVADPAPWLKKLKLREYNQPSIELVISPKQSLPTLSESATKKDLGKRGYDYLVADIVLNADLHSGNILEDGTIIDADIGILTDVESIRSPKGELFFKTGKSLGSYTHFENLTDKKKLEKSLIKVQDIFKNSTLMLSDEFCTASDRIERRIDDLWEDIKSLGAKNKKAPN